MRPGVRSRHVPPLRVTSYAHPCCRNPNFVAPGYSPSMRAGPGPLRPARVWGAICREWRHWEGDTRPAARLRGPRRASGYSKECDEVRHRQPITLPRPISRSTSFFLLSVRRDHGLVRTGWRGGVERALPPQPLQQSL